MKTGFSKYMQQKKGGNSVCSDGIQILRREKNVLAIMFGTLALLFQPFVKVALGRTMWNVVDVVVAIGLIVLYYKERNQSGMQ